MKKFQRLLTLDFMGLFFAFIASIFASASNFCMRRSIDAGGTTKAFILIQMSIACLVATLLGPVKSGVYSLNVPILLLGLASGLVLWTILYTLGQALCHGPPGLTFSILSASTILPGIVMATLFGATFGFIYTAWHGLGSLLVLAGLFWAGFGLQGLQNRKKWTLFVLLMFTFHVLLLVIYQWRGLLVSLPNVEGATSLFTKEQIQSEWYMPMLYLGAALTQLLFYTTTERRSPNPKEWLYGMGGGVTNCLCTLFLIQSTEMATGLENAVIFPLFSIGIILLSNWWGQKFYQEKINWRACQLCGLGLVIGTVDWKALAVFFGGG